MGGMYLSLLMTAFLLVSLSSCQLFHLYSSEDDICLETCNLDTGERFRLKQNYPLTLNKLDRKEHLQVEDIENMTKAGVSDDAILRAIDRTKSVFHLTPKNIQELREEGVSERVINYMRDTEEMH